MPTRLLFLCLLICFKFHGLFALDSLAKTKPKLIIGAKTIWEKSGPYSLVPWTYPVYSGGLQIIKPLNFWLLQFETGLYLNSRAISNYDQNPIQFGVNYSYIYFRYISIPVNFRVNTKYFYVSAGPNAEYLVRVNKKHWNNYDATNINKLELGINANAGLHWTFKKKVTVFVEGRFSQTYVSPPDNFVQDINFRNFGVGAGLNYLIGHKSKM